VIISIGVNLNYLKLKSLISENQSFAEAKKEWIDGLLAWERGERPEFCTADADETYWEYAGAPPDREYFAPFEKSECTWFQVWETVSEGTPITPPFATKEELVEYLVSVGDFWDGKWQRDSAVDFVMGSGWRPSGLFTGGKFYTSKDLVP